MPAANKLVADTSPSTPGSPDTNPSLRWDPNLAQWVAAGPGGGPSVIGGSATSGHVATKSVTVPTATAFAGSNNTSVSVAPGSTDAAGKILFTTPATVVTGSQVTLTFGTPYSAAPVVTAFLQVADQTSAIGPIALQAVSTTAATFGIVGTATLTASKAYTINYEAVEIGAAS